MLINVVLKIHKLPMNSNELADDRSRAKRYWDTKRETVSGSRTGQCYPEGEEAKERKSIDFHLFRPVNKMSSGIKP